MRVFCAVLSVTCSDAIRDTLPQGITHHPSQCMMSSAADSKNQGQTMGAVSALSSLFALVAPMLGAPLLALVSHLPHLSRGDWRRGTPFDFCTALQLASLALAVTHLRCHRRARLHHA